MTAATRAADVLMIGLTGTRWMSMRQLHACLDAADIPVHTLFFREDFEFGHPPSESEFDLAIEVVKETQPKLIGMGFTSFFTRDATEMTRRIREVSDAPIVWGGVHASVNPEESILVADMVCIGEGDEAIVELARSVIDGDGRTDIGNVWFRRGDEIIRNENRTLLKDLDSLPYSDMTNDDKSFVVGGELSWGENPTAYYKYEYDLMTARGCPYICSFCINHISMGPGARLRKRSVENVIGEIKRAREVMPEIQKIYFWDDVFTYDRKWLEQFAEAYRAEVGLPFFCYVHPNMIARPQARLLKEMGAGEVTMGIQHGSGEVRKELFDRYETNEEIVEAVRGLHEEGLHITLDTISSAFTDNDEDNRMNMELLLQLPKPFRLAMHGMTYFPNYKITDLALKRDLITPREVIGENTRREIGVSREEVVNDPWLCYQSITGKRTVPNGLIKYMIKHDWHARHPSLLANVTNVLMIWDRGARAFERNYRLLRKGEIRSIMQGVRNLKGLFTNR